VIKIKLKSYFSRFYDAYSVLTGRAFVYSKRIYEFHELSFSQDGEDMVLRKIFGKKIIRGGFYVDVGSHHPQRFSNTYYFYLRGWKGINIDPLPGCKTLFDALRPRDINLELGISDCQSELIYYAFEEPAFNTFDPMIAKSRLSVIISEKKVHVCRLSDVLDQYLQADQKVDFLSIDVEGLDLQVLRSNDWSRYRPSYVLAEVLEMSDIYQVIETELHQYMTSLGYAFFAKGHNTLIFVDTSSCQ
jgi:FkbM family methyltransferase